jgi:hypothetical protein
MMQEELFRSTPQPIRLWQSINYFSLMAFGSFTPTRIIFGELFQIVANSETSSMEIV